MSRNTQKHGPRNFGEPKHVQKILNTYLQGGQGNLSAEIVKSIPLFIPSPLEQDKIAGLFSLLDERISVQNKVIKSTKIAELHIRERLFYELSVPTMPLSSICNRIKDRNNELNKNVLTISARDGLVSHLDFFNKSVASENLSNYYLLHRGDYAYNKSYSSDYPWGAIKHLEKYEKGVLSPLYFCFRPNAELIDIEYLQCYFETSLWHKHIAEIAVEGARNHGYFSEREC